MTDPTTEFFEGLNHRPPDPLLGAAQGVVRFDLDDREGTRHWTVVLAKGSVSANMAARQADCVVAADARFFAQVVTGQANPYAALFRNQLSVAGDLMMWLWFNRLLPPVPGAHDPRDWVRIPDRDPARDQDPHRNRVPGEREQEGDQPANPEAGR